MVALSERKIAIVRTLVEAAGDKVVANLQAALAETGGDSPLGSVRRLVEAEVRERSLRNLVLQPLAPMCVGAGDDVHRVTFPARALGQVWRGLRATQSEEIDQLAHDLNEDLDPHLLAAAFDHLTAAAAAGVRGATTPDFQAAGTACEQARAGGGLQLAVCLELAPVVRRATHRLPEWLAHRGGETSAAARLAYKDSVVIAEDCGPLFFHMLAAQMAHP
jgi:hypothetical protein